MYTITRLYTGGILKGLTYTERTDVWMEVGYLCERPYYGSPYRIVEAKVNL